MSRKFSLHKIWNDLYLVESAGECVRSHQVWNCARVLSVVTDHQTICSPPHSMADSPWVCCKQFFVIVGTLTTSMITSTIDIRHPNQYILRTPSINWCIRHISRSTNSIRLNFTLFRNTLTTQLCNHLQHCFGLSQSTQYWPLSIFYPHMYEGVDRHNVVTFDKYARILNGCSAQY